MVDTITECESFFQNKINSMLVATSWVDNLKNLLGMEAVSQIWGDVPAWYVWLSDAQGAYQLQLVDAGFDEDNPLNKQGFFSIKCYPFHDATVFDTFSYEEQYLSQSGFFDETHTPRFEEKEKIPDSLFNVAAIEYRVNEDDTMACFTLDSLDAMRCVYPDETLLDFDLINKSRRYTKGETGRSVPGWKLGYPVFDRLLSMYAFYSKTKPVRLRITRSPGFEYVHAGNQLFECVDTPDTHRLSASVFFAPQGSPDHAVNSNELDMAEQSSGQGQAEVLLDQTFSCGHFHASHKMASIQINEDAPINELWWSLAHREYKSELASTCGCH